MSLTRVRVKLNGVWTTLTYNASTGRYEGDVTAPPSTSANLPGGYYVLEAEAVNSEGKVASISGTALRSLRLVVRETVAPTLALLSPPAGYINTRRPAVVLTASDEAGGSGIDPSSFAVVLDGHPQTAGLSTETAANGVRLAWTPTADLSEGPHTLSISISDRDGNTSTINAAYTVDVTPPGLTLSLPDTHRVVDSETIHVAGRAWDGISGPPSVAITVNGAERWRLPAADGWSADPVDFTADIPLDIAGNDIAVTATDGAGLATVEHFTVIRLVTDRVAADLEKLQNMFARGLDNWTDEEKVWFASTRCRRGGYDVLDVNRVELATDWIGTWLHNYGYFADWDAPAIWTAEGALRLSDAARYLERIAEIQNALTAPDGTPETPKDMRAALTLQGANDIEAILVAVDALRPLLERSWWCCGEIGCGEV